MLGSAGLGLVAAGLGAILGLEAHAQRADAELHCSFACDDQGKRSWSSANEDAALSSIAFAVGGAAAASGIVMWMTAPPDTRADEVGSSPFPLGPAALIVAGAASLGAGVYLGLHTIDAKRERDAACSTGSCTAAGVAHDADAMSSATLSTAAVVGGVALATAGGTWLLLDRGLGTRGKGSAHRTTAGTWVLATLGLAGVGAGIYFGARAASDESARDKACRGPGGGCSPAALRDDADARASASIGGLALGAAALTLSAAAALWIRDASRAAAHARWRMMPLLTPQGGGLVLAGGIE